MEQARDLLQQLHADAREALGQRSEARRHHRARLFRGQVFAQAAAVVGVQVVRQFGDQLRRHRHGARVAVAGGDAIDGAVFAQQAVEEVRPSRDRRAEFRRPDSTALADPSAISTMSSMLRRVVESNRTSWVVLFFRSAGCIVLVQRG